MDCFENQGNQALELSLIVLFRTVTKPNRAHDASSARDADHKPKVVNMSHTIFRVQLLLSWAIRGEPELYASTNANNYLYFEILIYSLDK